MTIRTTHAARTLRALALVGVACAGLEAGASERVIVMPDGTSRVVDLLALDGGTIRFEEDGLVRTLATADVLGVVQSDTVPYAPFGSSGGDPRYASVELVTGERYPGTLEAGSEDSITISHDLFGRLALPIDRVSLVRFGDFEGPVPTDPTGEDIVLLANGDSAKGFVLALDEALTIELTGTPRVLSLDSLAAVRLANPAESPVGTVVWLDDGSIARVDEIGTGSGARVTLRSTRTAADETAAVRTFDIGAVLFDASRVRPLAGMPASVSLPTDRRWSAMPEITSVHADPLMFTPDLLVPGPMTIVWDIPRESQRVSMTVELPEPMRTWGDCVVSLAFETPTGDVEGPSARVHHDRPIVTLGSDLPPSTRRVVFTLDEGKRGPAQDRVLLRRPMLLMPSDQ